MSQTTRERVTRLPRDQRRAQLLSAALEVFTASGYHSAAMDEIAERAGVSKPVLYQHFPSKLELYLAVLDLHIDSLLFALQRGLASTHDNAQRVRATVETYFAFVDGESEAFRLLFESDLTSDPAVNERLTRMTNECATAASAVIAADTGLPEEAAMLLGVGLIATAQATARYWLERDGRLSRERACELVANLQWRGISGFPLTEH